MRASASTLPDRPAIREGQLAKLRTLLTAVFPANPFYAAKLAGCDLDSSVGSLEEFTARAPFTTKAELAQNQTDHPPYGSNLTYPLSRYTRFNQTSGTTGRPMRWLDTPESWEWMTGCWIQVFQSAGITPEDRVFFPFSFGPFLGFWVAFEAASKMGCLAIPAGGMRSRARLQTLFDNGATVVCCTPSYAIHLAEIAADEQFDLAASKVRRIVVAGEPGGSIPSTRALMENLWPGARIVDHHGMTEIGPASYECPQRPGVLHIIESGFFPEVIDRGTMQPTGPGEVGELVLTNLGRLGSPLLRYRTGDLVRRSEMEPCVCGSHELALEGGILARHDGMVIVRGVNVYPSAVEDVLRSCGVLEFRAETFTERALTEISIQVEPAPECPDPARLADRVAAALQNALSLRVRVSCVPRGVLPRFEGKANRWVRR